MEGLGLEPGLSQGFPSPQWPSLPRCMIGSQISRAESLRIGSNLPLFTLSVCSPLSQHWHLCSRGEQCWCKRGPCTLQWDGHRQMPLICHLCKHQQCLPPPSSDTASGLFCPSQVITTPSLHCPHPLVADRAHVGFGHVLRCGLCWSSLDQTSEPPLSP